MFNRRRRHNLHTRSTGEKVREGGQRKQNNERRSDPELYGPLLFFCAWPRRSAPAHRQAQDHAQPDQPQSNHARTHENRRRRPETTPARMKQRYNTIPMRTIKRPPAPAHPRTRATQARPPLLRDTPALYSRARGITYSFNISLVQVKIKERNNSRKRNDKRNDKKTIKT